MSLWGSMQIYFQKVLTISFKRLESLNEAFKSSRKLFSADSFLQLRFHLQPPACSLSFLSISAPQTARLASNIDNWKYRLKECETASCRKWYMERTSRIGKKQTRRIRIRYCSASTTRMTTRRVWAVALENWAFNVTTENLKIHFISVLSLSLCHRLVFCTVFSFFITCFSLPFEQNVSQWEIIFHTF